LAVEPLNEMFYFWIMFYFLHCSIVKNLLLVVKIQNVVEYVYIRRGDFTALKSTFKERHGYVYDNYRIGIEEEIKTDPKSVF
jgi:ABC-type transport system involved in multi-copper enzyme maturation permease subunit